MMSVIGKRSSLRDRHVHARHQREVEGHVALVAVAEILTHVFRPHVGFGQQQAVRVARIERGAHLLQDRVGLGQVLVAGALALDQVGDRVQPEPVDAHVEPEAHDALSTASSTSDCRSSGPAGG
jgi:hypothetical protein